MKKLTRKQAEAIYAMWEARAERLMGLPTTHPFKRSFYKLGRQMEERCALLKALIAPPEKKGFIEGWKIVD